MCDGKRQNMCLHNENDVPQPKAARDEIATAARRIRDDSRRFATHSQRMCDVVICHDSKCRWDDPSLNIFLCVGQFFVGVRSFMFSFPMATQPHTLQSTISKIKKNKNIKQYILLV